MLIHVVAPGETLFSVAARYGLSAPLLAAQNGISPTLSLVVGQTLVVSFPQRLYTVQAGDSLSSVAQKTGVPLRQLLQNNPQALRRGVIFAEETLVLDYGPAPYGSLTTGGYAYDRVSLPILGESQPYLSSLAPFTYGFTETGELISPNDAPLLAAAEAAGVTPLLHLSTLTAEGRFSSERGSALLNAPALWPDFADRLLQVMEEKGYGGLDVDFEFLPPADAVPYSEFIAYLGSRIRPTGRFVMVAVAPKTSDTQPGNLYESHDYAALGAAADYVLLMAYEWGYTYGPPMAVAPLNRVEEVLRYAVSRIPAEKIVLGMPNYGYDFTLPYVRGESRARSIGNEEAVAMAREAGAEIFFDETAQAPYFLYTDPQGKVHEVWFSDARSIAAETALLRKYGIDKQSFWNLMRPWVQGWMVLRGEYDLREGMP